MEATWSHLFNLYLFSFSILCLFTAFFSIQNLETSLNEAHCSNCVGTTSGSCQNHETGECVDMIHMVCDKNCPENFEECQSTVGSIAMGGLYLVCMISSTFTSLIIEHVGEKRSLLWAFSTFCLFCIANMIISLYPGNTALHWILLFPSSCILGFGTAVYWSAHGPYLTRIAGEYAIVAGCLFSHAIGEFNGIFWSIFQMSQILGNLSSSLVLRTLRWSEATLFGLYFCLSVIAMAIMSCTRALPIIDKQKEELEQLLPRTPSSWYAVMSNSIGDVSQMCQDRRMLLIIPFMIFNGLEQAFAWGDFTADFVRPSVGEDSIGYVMVCYGIAEVVGAYLSGEFSDRIGRWHLFVIGGCCFAPALLILGSASVQLCDLQWEMLIGCAIALGLGDSIYSTILYVVVGDLFTDNLPPSYSTYTVFHTMGASAAFLYGPILSSTIRIAILLFWLALGTITFAFIQFPSLRKHFGYSLGHGLP